LFVFQQGFVTNWELEKAIWDYVFYQDAISLKGKDVVLTEQQFSPKTLRRNTIQV
jgi:actin-related protein